MTRLETYDDLERQLRSAISAKANGITADRLRNDPTPNRPRPDAEVIRLRPPDRPEPGRGRVTVLVAAVAAVVLALVVGVTVVQGRRHDQGVQTFGRNDVPWAEVGAGWTLVQSNPAYADVKGSDELFLIDPTGRDRYLIEDLAGTNWELSSWSPANASALFIQSLDGHQTNLIVFSPRTLAHTTITVTASYLLAQWIDKTHFVLSSGSAALLFGSVSGGKPVLAPAHSPWAGSISGVAPVTLADGQVAVGTDKGIAVFGADGRLMRTVDAPAGYSQCTTSGAWDASTVTALCGSVSGSPAGNTVLFSTTEGTAHPIGPEANPAWRLWKLDNGTFGYLDDAGATGPGHFGRLGSDGRITELAFPSHLVNTQFYVIGAVGSRIYVRFFTTAWQRQGVLAFDPATGAQTVLSVLGQPGTSMPMIAPYGMLPELPR